VQRDSALAEYALRDVAKPIGVSTYRVTRELPGEVRDELPTVEDLQEVVANLRSEMKLLRQERDEELHLDSPGESDCRHVVATIVQQPAAQLAFRDQSRGWLAMNVSLIHIEQPSAVPAFALIQAGAKLRQMVLDSVPSIHSKRNYAKALDDLFAFSTNRPLSHALLMEYRTSMENLSPSTINVRMSAIRKLVGEARQNGLIGLEEAANLTDVPNVRQTGTRLGNWLTREQAKELLGVPDRSKLKGKRDYVILALLVGCALRRQELASLTIEDIQLREGRWVIIDLRGKGGRIRTVAVPIWVKQGIDAWITAAKIEKGRLLRPLSKSGKMVGEELGDWAIWSVVEQSSKQIGIEHFGAHDLRRTCAKLCRKNGGDLEQIKFLLGHSSIQTTERYLGSEQEIAVAVNDNLGL
jgi:integrase